MTSLICGFIAIIQAAFDMFTVCIAAILCNKTTSENTGSDNTQKQDSYVDAYPNRSKLVTAYHGYAKNNILSKECPTSKVNTSAGSEAAWCSNHMDLLIQITTASAKEFIIPSTDLNNVDIQELSNLLFEQIENIRSIDQIDAGLKITTN